MLAELSWLLSCHADLPVCLWLLLLAGVCQAVIEVCLRLRHHETTNCRQGLMAARPKAHGVRWQAGLSHCWVMSHVPTLMGLHQR